MRDSAMLSVPASRLDTLVYFMAELLAADALCHDNVTCRDDPVCPCFYLHPDTFTQP